MRGVRVGIWGTNKQNYGLEFSVRCTESIISQYMCVNRMSTSGVISVGGFSVGIASVAACSGNLPLPITKPFFLSSSTGAASFYHKRRRQQLTMAGGGGEGMVETEARNTEEWGNIEN